MLMTTELASLNATLVIRGPPTSSEPIILTTIAPVSVGARFELITK